MSELCPVCETGIAQKIKRRERILWKGRSFLVDYDAYHCSFCKEIYIKASSDDPFAKAKEKYEELYGGE